MSCRYIKPPAEIAPVKVCKMQLQQEIATILDETSIKYAKLKDAVEATNFECVEGMKNLLARLKSELPEEKQVHDMLVEAVGKLEADQESERAEIEAQIARLSARLEEMKRAGGSQDGEIHTFKRARVASGNDGAEDQLSPILSIGDPASVKAPASVVTNKIANNVLQFGKPRVGQAGRTAPSSASSKNQTFVTPRLPVAAASKTKDAEKLQRSKAHSVTAAPHKSPSAMKPAVPPPDGGFMDQDTQGWGS